MASENSLQEAISRAAPGKVNLEAARHYVETQAAHHGYRGDWTKPLRYRNPNFRSPAFPLAHSFCLLNYHVVFATQDRIPIFDEIIAPGLFQYAIRVGDKHGFAIDRMGLMPDHFHLLLEAKSDVAIEECARALMENTRWWMERRYWGFLKRRPRGMCGSRLTMQELLANTRQRKWRSF
jgi:REP element-mobilizing transposase RayT